MKHGDDANIPAMETLWRLAVNERKRRWMTSSHLLASVAGLIATARRRSRERAELAMMEDRDLRDFGSSRATLAFELNKPFWRG